MNDRKATMNDAMSDTSGEWPWRLQRRSGFRSGLTLPEFLVVVLLFTIILFATYKVFFSQTRMVQQSVESVMVNDQFRKVLFYMGKDVREASLIQFPPMVRPEDVAGLTTKTGVVLQLIRQEIDPSIKPNATGMQIARTQEIVYKLEPIGATNDDDAGPPSSNPRFRLVRLERVKEAEANTVEQRMEVTDMVRDLVIYRTIRKPMINQTIDGEDGFVLDPVTPRNNGTGYGVVHIRTILERDRRRTATIEREVYGVSLATSFSMRGKALWKNQ